MLQRAASNAYSWWWASHIRTKQSKWLEQSLQDMEEKVQGMIKLIEEDGDSFAKRAEMYYKRRPELINSVEEAYKAFRSLADRYDMLSKEFQTANHTIATVFPEQVPYNIDQDDKSHAPKVPKNIPPPVNMNNIPKTPPNAPFKDLKRLITKASKELKDKKVSKEENSNKVVVKSGLTKDEALEEIDKLHKDILALQTVKEFVKSSYESGLAKYWGIENQITEMQQKVCRLQDEFNVDTVIEDDEARALMADAALKSCQEILTQLQEKQERAERVAKEEYDKIEAARVILESLRHKYLHGEKPSEKEEKPVIKETEPLEEKSEENPDCLMGSLTVTQLAEKIDNLVNKVIRLETAVSSQTVLINTLRTESDDLHGQIQHLENEKDSLVNDTQNLSTVVKEMEVKLTKIQDLTKNVERQNSNLQTDFAEARSSLDHLSEKVSCVKPEEEIEETEEPVVDVKEVDVNVEKPPKKCHVMFLGQKLKKVIPMTRSHKSVKSESDVDLSWQQMLLSGVDDREKILLKEYTEILRNYKDVKKKLSDMEKKDRDSQFDIVLKMKEQKKAILKRDEEIQNLRKRLSLDLDEDRSLTPDEEIEFVEVNKVIEENYDIPITIIEEKFRNDIDAILDENLEFWLRFSTVFHQIKKFKTEVSDLQNEIEKLEDKKEQGHVTSEMKSEARPLYKHLREIQTELTVWLEQSVPLKEEIKRRFALLCGIQEEITKAMNEGDEEDETGFNSHKAAIFQGEILNMKQENNKVKEELQSGFDHVSLLQLEIEKTLMKLSEEFGISSDQPELKDAMSRSKIPLRSFIFGRKTKKARSSIFSRYHILRAALPPSKHS